MFGLLIDDVLNDKMLEVLIGVSIFSVMIFVVALAFKGCAENDI